MPPSLRRDRAKPSALIAKPYARIADQAPWCVVVQDEQPKAGGAT